MLTKINDLNDVVLFTKELIAEGVNLHPDDDFNNYLNIETNAPTYSKAEADLRNSLMTQSFEVCQNMNEDIYNLMQDIYLTETGLDKFIPKSTDNVNFE